jgi:hypothetical protein
MLKIANQFWQKLSVVQLYLLVHRRLYRCSTEFLGTVYGGWTICLDGISESSIVYSFGVGEDASFDLAVIERYGAEVHAFDPTPSSIDWVNKQT